MPRACLDCVRPALPGASRCAVHGGQHVTRRRQAPGTGAASRLRAAVNAAGVAQCALCRGTYPAAGVEIDHALALRDGGTDTPGNVRALCSACHRSKTQRENAARRHAP